MSKSIFLSTFFHFILIVLTAMGLPFMLKKPIDLPPIISIELIEVADITNIPYAPKAKKILEKIKKEEERVVSEQAPPKITKKEKPEAIPLPEDIAKQEHVQLGNNKIAKNGHHTSGNQTTAALTILADIIFFL